MHRGQSLYLDWLRVVAALEVLAYHLRNFTETGVAPSVWNKLGPEAVDVFFVLSGFVIRHAAGSRDHTLRDFSISRLTRVYSVAIPALLLTLLFDRLGQMLNPALYDGFAPWGSPYLRLAIGAAMLNETWVSVQMLSNTPYWSLSYEFWYYAVFGALFYLRGTTRWVLALIAALIGGPKIMLLFPIWLMGWYAYSERWSARCPRWLTWVMFLQPILVVTLYYQFGVMWSVGAALEAWMGHDAWRNGLSWSRYVLTDTMLGVSVMFNLMAAKHLGPALEAGLGWASRPIRWTAASSFTLYLIHQPALLLVTTAVSPYVQAPLRGFVVVALVLAIVFVVSIVTEGQRYRLKPVFERLLRARHPITAEGPA